MPRLKAGQPSATAVKESIEAAQWPVLAECPAFAHNTLYAARGRGGRAKCICPHARDRVREENARIRGKQPSLLTRVTPLKEDRRTLRDWPRLEGGACQSAQGRAIFDSARGKDDGQYARETAQWMCANRCPVREQCALMLAVEYPAGSWGGVIAGLNADQRRRLVGLHP